MDSLVSGFLMNFFFCLLRMTFSEEGLNYFKGQKLIARVDRTDLENLSWVLGIYGSEYVFRVVYSKIYSTLSPRHSKKPQHIINIYITYYLYQYILQQIIYIRISRLETIRRYEKA